MTAWIVWAISVSGMVTLGAWSYLGANRRSEFAFVGPITTGDILRSEAHTLTQWGARVIRIYWPVVERSLATGLKFAFGHLGRTYHAFLDKVFGKEEIAKGRSTSFFLKYISEFKEELSKDDRI